MGEREEKGWTPLTKNKHLHILWKTRASPRTETQSTCFLKYPFANLPKSEGREWGVASVVVGFGVFGAPQFSVQRSQNPSKISILGPLDWKSWRPKNAKSNHDGSNPPFSALLQAARGTGANKGVLTVQLEGARFLLQRWFSLRPSASLTVIRALRFPHRAHLLVELSVTVPRFQLHRSTGCLWESRSWPDLNHRAPCLFC